MRFLAIVIASLVVIATSSMSQVRDYDWPDIPSWVWELSTVDSLADYDLVYVEWEMVEDHRELTRRDKVTRSYRYRWRVLGEQGREIADHVISRSSRSMKVKQISGRVVRPNGAVVELTRDDLRERETLAFGDEKITETYVVFPGVESDCVIDLFWKMESEAPLRTIEFQADYPILSARVVWHPDLPNLSRADERRRYFNLGPRESSRVPHYYLSGFGEIPFDVQEIQKDGFLETLVFTADQLPAASPIDYWIPESEQVARLYVYYTRTQSPHEYWSAYSKNVHDVRHRMLERAPSLNLLVESRWDRSWPARELAVAVNTWVRDSIAIISDSYVDGEMSIHVPTPLRLEYIVSMRRAYESDLTEVIWALLQTLGVDARLVYAANRERRVVHRPLKLLQFTDFLLAIPEPGPTSETEEFFFFGPYYPEYVEGQLPWFLENTSVLIGGEPDRPFRPTGYSPSDMNRSSTRIAIQIDSASTTGSLSYTMTGHPSWIWRMPPTGMRDEDIAQMAAEAFDSLWLALSFDSLSFSNLSDASRPIVFDARVAFSEDPISEIGGRRFIDPATYLRNWENPFGPKRTKPVIYPGTFLSVDTVVLVLSPDLAIDAEEIDTSFTNAVGAFSLHLWEQHDTLRLARTVELSVPVIDTSAYGDLRELFAAPLAFTSLPLSVVASERAP